MTKNKWHSLLAATLTLLMLWVFIPQAQAIKANNDYDYSESYKSNKYYTNLMNVSISGNQRDDIVNVALSQLGYHEGNNNNDLSGCSTGQNNYTEYNYWFEKGSAGWPATFVSWCARQAKIGTDIIKNASRSSPNDFGIAFYKRGSYTPMRGDFIFFDWESQQDPEGWDQVGIVESVNGNQVTFICGNYTDKVSLDKTNISNPELKGYGVPDYKTISLPFPITLQDIKNPYPIPINTLDKSSPYYSDYVRWVQWQLNWLGYNCGAVDGCYGNNTANAVKAFQEASHLPVNGIVDHETLCEIIIASIPQYYTICTVFAEMHESPSSSSVFQARISEGATLRVKSISNGWGKVKYNNQDGWIPLSNCIFDGSINRTYTVIAPNNPKNTIPLRTAPNSSATIGYNILDGSLLHVDYFHNGWGRTIYKEREYWINLCYCKYNSSMSRYYTISISSASTLNMYKDHSSSSAVKDQIPNGATLRVQSFYNGWGKVTYKSQDGWILLSKCKYNSSINRTYTVITPGSSLELRTAPNSSAAIVFRVPDGALLHVDYFYNGWGRTTYNGEQCWVNLRYCKYNSGMNRNYTVLANPLTMYAGNSTSTNVRTTIPCGTVIRVTSFKNGWGQTTYNGETGWVDLHLCSYNP